MSLANSPSSLLITCPYHLILASLTFSAMSTTPHIFWSLYSTMSLTSSPSSLLITCPHHLNLAYLTFSAISTTPHLLISSFHNVSGQLSFISSYYMSIPLQHCFPHLLFIMCTTSYLLNFSLSLSFENLSRTSCITIFRQRKATVHSFTIYTHVICSFP
jgi:hypothetical protein